MFCFPGDDRPGCNVLPVDCAQAFFGCCPDGVSEASGPDLAGCDGVIVQPESGCASTKYGCCLDQETPALGPEMEGCEDKEEEVSCVNGVHLFLTVCIRV